jgi:hypothetical protein
LYALRSDLRRSVWKKGWQVLPLVTLEAASVPDLYGRFFELVPEDLPDHPTEEHFKNLADAIPVVGELRTRAWRNKDMGKLRDAQTMFNEIQWVLGILRNRQKKDAQEGPLGKIIGIDGLPVSLRR